MKVNAERFAKEVERHKEAFSKCTMEQLLMKRILFEEALRGLKETIPTMILNKWDATGNYRSIHRYEAQITAIEHLYGEQELLLCI